MSKDSKSSKPEPSKIWSIAAPRLAAWALERLVNRTDAWGGYYRKFDKSTQQTETRTTTRKEDDVVGGSPAGPLDLAKLTAHFRGRHTDHIVGVHALGPDGFGKWVGFDVDAHDDQVDVGRNENYARFLFSKLSALGFRPLMYSSNGKGGFHVWVLFDSPVPGPLLHSFAKWAIADCSAFGVEVEANPKQPTIGEGKFGNWLRVPGRHHTREHWPVAWTGTTWSSTRETIELILGHDGDSWEKIPAAAYPEPEPEPHREEIRRREYTHGDPPWVMFNRNADFPAMLEADGAKRASGIQWIRPGKDSGTSGTLGFKMDRDSGCPLLFNWSPNWYGLAAGKFYTPFDFEVSKRHGRITGDTNRQTIEALRAEGRIPPATKSKPGPRPGADVRTGSTTSAKPEGSSTRRAVAGEWVPFPTDALPHTVAWFVTNVAESIGCDPSLVAIPALALLGASVGMSHMVSPKRGWKEPPIIWAAAIGKSGTQKSPGYRESEDIAEDINDDLEEEFRQAFAEYEDKMASRDPDSDERPPPRPVKRSFSKGDLTIEALVGTLQDNPRGILVANDELDEFIKSFTKYAGKAGSSDLAKWLKLFSAGTINYTRKTGDRREVRVRGVGVSLCGTIQPGVMARAMTPEFRESGFLARMLLAYPPKRRREWVDKEIADNVRSEFAELVSTLYRMPVDTWPGGRLKPSIVPLAPDARKAFIAFYNANGEDMEVAADDEAAAFSKLEAYALRFALLFHVCRHRGKSKDSPIARSDVEAAIRLTAWFKAETERCYALLAETSEVRRSRDLAEVVLRLAHRLAERRGDGQLRVTPRDLQNHNTRKFRRVEDAELALETLVADGFGRWEQAPRPSRGGHAVSFYVPLPTSDTSYTRSSDESPSASDTTSYTRPNSSDTRQPGSRADFDATTCFEGACDENPFNSAGSSVGSVGCRTGYSGGEKEAESNGLTNHEFGTSVGNPPASVGHHPDRSAESEWGEEPFP